MATINKIDGTDVPELSCDATQWYASPKKVTRDETLGGKPVLYFKEQAEKKIDFKSADFWTAAQIESVATLGNADTYTSSHIITIGLTDNIETADYTETIGGRFRYEDEPWLSFEPVVQYNPPGQSQSIYTNVVLKFAEKLA